MKTNSYYELIKLKESEFFYTNGLTVQTERVWNDNNGIGQENGTYNQ